MTAETVADTSTSRWILYARELEFVAGYTGSIDSAEELLLDYLGQPGRIIRWLPRKLEYGSLTPAQIEETKKTLLRVGLGERAIKGYAIEGYLGRALEFFFQPNDHSRIAVDRVNSNATRTGPPWVVGSNSHIELVDGKLTPVEHHWPIFLPSLAPVTLKAKTIRLHHDDAVATLRWIGLLPAQASINTQPARGAAQPPTRLLTPDEWLVEARKLPRRPGESRIKWLGRLHELHLQASLSKHWSKATLSRRLYDRT